MGSARRIFGKRRPDPGSCCSTVRQGERTCPRAQILQTFRGGLVACLFIIHDQRRFVGEQIRPIPISVCIGICDIFVFVRDSFFRDASVLCDKHRLFLIRICHYTQATAGKDQISSVVLKEVSAGGSVIPDHPCRITRIAVQSRFRRAVDISDRIAVTIPDCRRFRLDSIACAVDGNRVLSSILTYD